MASAPRLVIREFGRQALDCPLTALPPEELHVWHWQPACSPQELADLWRTLSEDEQRRAQQYRFPKHRDEFVVNRARLRSLLGSYVAESPGDLAFEYSSHGKPSLPEAGALRFNLSHTEGRAALAVVQGREVGIDVEEVRPQDDIRRIADRFFSIHERQALEGLSGAALDKAFFRCWTRKEAYIKAKGGGLSIPLRDFDVSLAEGEPAALLSTRPDREEAQRWLFYDLPLPPGYSGAVAIAAAAMQP